MHFAVRLKGWLGLSHLSYYASISNTLKGSKALVLSLVNLLKYKKFSPYILQVLVVVIFISLVFGSYGIDVSLLLVICSSLVLVGWRNLVVLREAAVLIGLLLIGAVSYSRSSLDGRTIELFLRLMAITVLFVLLPLVLNKLKSNGVEVGSSYSGLPVHIWYVLILTVTCLLVIGAWQAWADSGRLSHYAYGHTHFGLLLASLWIVHVYLGCWDYANNSPNIKNIMLWLVTFCVLSGALLLNQSRGVWLALIGTIVLLAWVTFSWRMLVGMLIGAFFLAIPVWFFAGDMVQHRLDMAVSELVQYLVYGSQSGSVAERLGMWQSSVRAGLQNVLFGVGVDGLAALKETMLASGEISEQVARRQLQHSDLLQSFAVYGLCGIIVYLYFWLFLGKKASSLLVWLLIGLVLFAGLTDHYSYLISTVSQITALLVVGSVLSSYYPVRFQIKFGLISQRVFLLLALVVGSTASTLLFIKIIPQLNKLEFGQETNVTLVKSAVAPNQWVVIRTANSLLIELPECAEQQGEVIYADVFGLHESSSSGTIGEYNRLFSSKFVPDLREDGSCLVTWSLPKNYTVKKVVVGMHNYGPRLSEYHIIFNDHFRLIQR